MIADMPPVLAEEASDPYGEIEDLIETEDSPLNEGIVIEVPDTADKYQEIIYVQYVLITLDNAQEGELIPYEPPKTYLGEYTLTAYCATGNPCADGVMPSENHTIACNDPMLWHRWVLIEGLGIYYCHDTGGMPSNRIIDVYINDYSSCIRFGVKSADVYLIER